MTDRKFLKPVPGGWGELVSREEYVVFLRRCADSWERGGLAKPNPEQAARIRAKADRIENKEE